MTRRRIVRVTLGYLVATLVASALITALMAYTLHFFGQEEYAAVDYLRAGWSMSLQGILVTFAPSLLLIVLTEIYRWRNLLIYELAGAILPLPMVYSFDAGFIAEDCAIGAAAGFIYWLAAGRTAGTRG